MVEFAVGRPRESSFSSGCGKAGRVITTVNTNKFRLALQGHFGGKKSGGGEAGWHTITFCSSCGPYAPCCMYKPPGQAEAGHIRFRNHRGRAQPRLHQRHLT